MTTTQWPQVRSILEQALEQPPGAREAFLARACNGDRELRAEIEQLLSYEASAETLLKPMGAGIADLMNADTVEPLGARLGAYRLTGLIAAGGMGAVYRASRDDDQFDRDVAIKIFAGSLRSTSAVARFHRERQILARLDHPSIISLIDGGTTNDGRPYIVMEYAKGVPLTEHADTHNLSVRERLELFERVCRSVQFAHRNLIVHRDLKPGNILVTDEGEVKLLDFGVSKLIEDDSPVTTTVAAPMTVRYCSPEQLSGGAITTATDVYSLGVLLYELLTNQQPYDSGTSLPEAMAAVCKTVPAAPSHVNDDLNDELDAIALHALMKEPGHRYPTVEAFADDVRRHLDGQAVLAHPPTRWYLWRKAAWRYRWQLSLATTVFVLVVAFAAIAASLAVRLSHEKNAAVAAEQREKLERQAAEDINGFLATTLISADPLLDGRADLSLLKVINDASARMHSFEGPAAAKAALHLTIGRAYLNLWLAQDAEPHLEQAIELFRADVADTIQLADALEAMAAIHTFQFDSAAAIARYRECLNLRRYEMEVDREPVARASIKLAMRLGSDRADEAQRLIADALRLRRSIHVGDHESIAEALDKMALLHMQAGESDAAMEAYDEAMQMRLRLVGRVHDTYAAGLETGAEIHQRLDNAERAAELYAEAIELRRTLYGPQHPSMVQPMLHRAVLIDQLGEPAAGGELLTAAVAMAQDTLPPWHRTVRYARSVYGIFSAGEGRFEIAEPHMLAAYEGTLRHWGEDNALAAHLRRHMCAMYSAWDRSDEAAHYYRGSDYSDGEASPHGRCPSCGFNFAE